MNACSLPIRLAALPIWIASALPPGAAADPGYLRYPDIHGSTVVFCAEGDMWSVAVGGGDARRLTTHVGAEYFPRFSPDGSTLAFTGHYDGNFDVYVVSAQGGEPRRLTWHPSADEVLGWTPDGEEILFRSRRDHPHGNYMIYAIPRGGGDPRVLPIGRAGRIAMDPETGWWAFNRTYRERRTWKRYRGGTNEDIWVGDPESADFRKVTDFTGTDAMPMWHGGRIWFVSDLGGTYNLWSMKPDGSDRRRHTDEQDWDVRWPNLHSGKVVFMLAGDIHLYDIASGEERKLAIDLPSERVLTRTRYPDPENYTTWFDLSPQGDRIALVTRGEIFSVPVEEGVTLPLSGGSGARESWASFDPKGERIVYVTDASREEAIHEMDAWGRGEEKILKPAGKTGWHFPPRYSPDGKWIAFADQTPSLFVMKADGGLPKIVARSDYEEIRHYAWSPDGRYLAYELPYRTDFFSIFVYDTRSGRTHRITGGDTMDSFPAWDPDGRYLYFLSNRTVNPILGNRDFENIEARSAKPYLVLLKKDAKNPFVKTEGLPPDEEEDEDGKKDEEEKEGKKEKKEKKEKKIEPVEIDFEGIGQRVVEVPVEAGIHRDLAASSTHLYYLSRPVRGMNEPRDEEGPVSSLMVFDLEEKEEKVFAQGVSAFDLEVEAGKIALQKKRGHFLVVDAGSPPDEESLGEGAVSLEGVVLELDPREEWVQIYYEGWRHMRDFYWEPNMGGVPWEEIRDRYATLLGRLSIREDLRDLMGEVIGELATSHTYVWGGDPGTRPPRFSTGLLGADLVREGRYFRVERIYRGAPADLDRSPLVEPGVGVKEGDYILAVNRRPFAPDRPFHAALEKLSGMQVLLTVNDRPTEKGARDVVVTPLDGERRLRYIDWVRRNRERIDRETDGRIGYIHLPDMGTRGLVEFNRWFYPQLDREGMIVDCRWNGGGFVSQLILERFRRHVLSFDRSRAGGVYTYPYRTLNGPFVVLTNEQAGSDGDIFPYAVQQEKLAPVIGQRSWGGVIGIRNDKRLVDGGGLTQPEYAWWDAERGWAIENHGVDPDIEVVNLPQDVARGMDAQLDRAITEVLRLHEKNPPVKATFSDPIPDRSRETFRRRELE